jgi:hypothetical protein
MAKVMITAKHSLALCERGQAEAEVVPEALGF